MHDAPINPIFGLEEMTVGLIFNAIV